MNFTFIRVERRKTYTVIHPPDSENLNPEPSGTEARPHDLTLLSDTTTNNFSHIIKESMGQNRVAQLTIAQLINQFPISYGVDLLHTSQIQSLPSHTSLKPLLILPSYLQLHLPNDLFPFDYPTKTVFAGFSPCILHVQSISHYLI